MTDEETRRRLLAVARDAIVACTSACLHEVEKEPAVDIQGVFVTLRRRRDHELRGCIGLLRPPQEGLPRLVAEAARASALRDPRFDPVAADEVEGLQLEISLLGPLTPIRAEDVEVGRHGLVVRARGRSGLLLPQVPAEHGWDRATYLESVCRKAGLPPGSWRDPDCELLAFTAEVFGDATSR